MNIEIAMNECENDKREEISSICVFFTFFLNRSIDKIRKHRAIIKSRNFMENLIIYCYYFLIGMLGEKNL